MNNIKDRIMGRITMGIAFMAMLAFAVVPASAQTTITTTSPTPAWWSTQSSTIVFGVRNTNAYPMVLTHLSNYAPSGHTATYTLWYHPTIVTGVPTAITTANGWIQLPISAVVPTTAGAGVVPIFSAINLTFPGNTTYRLALVASQNGPWYGASGSTGTLFSGGGIEIYAQNNPTSPTYVGYFPGPPNNTPRTFFGSLTFAPASDNDLTGVSIVQPLNNVQLCPSPLQVKVSVKNSGTLAQSNFPVNAYFSGTSSGVITTTYTGTLASGASATVDLPFTSFAPGTYTIKGVAALATDTLHQNDTTPAVSFVVKPYVATPTAYSDTVCAGDNAFVYIDAVSNTTYNWYAAPSGGSPLIVANSAAFNPLAQDTVMYVSAFSNGCESGRAQISAIIGPPPVVNLGPDTSFCESIPLVLDGGNPGGSYLWSTGDTTQSIPLTNQSGTFWVTVDKYCIASDTVNVTIAPLPVVSGISYVRMNRTYHFTPSSDLHVQNYLWIFGDGATSTLREPIHTYAIGHTSAVEAQLIVSNDCGTDSAFRSIPTDVSDIQEEDRKVNLYPNPAQELITITVDQAQISEVMIVDVIGKTVLQHVCSGSNRETVNVSSLAPGNYLVRITTDDGHTTRKLTIQR